MNLSNLNIFDFLCCDKFFHLFWRPAQQRNAVQKTPGEKSPFLPETNAKKIEIIFFFFNSESSLPWYLIASKFNVFDIEITE